MRKPRLFYFLPFFHTVSFQFVAKWHVYFLRELFNVFQLDEKFFYSKLALFFLPSHKVSCLHPFFYLAFERESHLKLLRLKTEYIVGFDVADSTAISPKAVKVANMCDLIIVPTEFSKEVFENSGVETRIEVIPHGVPEEFKIEKIVIKHPLIKKLTRMKLEKKYFYILYFLWHSWKRKGAHLVYEVMKEIQKEFLNVVLLLKTGTYRDPFVEILLSLRTIEVSGFMSLRTLIELYSIADVVIVPSLAGGFEWNALEAIALGIPTIVPNSPFFNHIKKYAITIDNVREVEVYEDNPIHIGKGYEPEPNTFYNVLKDVILNYPSYKEKFVKQRYEVLEKFSWSNIGRKLISIFSEFTR